jgi:hypothetical protein
MLFAPYMAPRPIPRPCHVAPKLVGLKLGIDLNYLTTRPCHVAPKLVGLKLGIDLNYLTTRPCDI